MFCLYKRHYGKKNNYGCCDVMKIGDVATVEAYDANDSEEEIDTEHEVEEDASNYRLLSPSTLPSDAIPNLKKILHTSWPFIGNYIFSNLKDFIGARYLYADGGNDATAAYSLISTSQVFVMISFQAPLYTVSALVGQKFGAKKEASAGAILQQAWMMGMLLSVPPAVLFLASKPIFQSLGESENLSQIIESYYQGYSIGIPALALLTCNIQFLSAVKQQKMILALSILSLCIDIPIKYILVFGKFGMPSYGAFGLGLGNSIQTIISCLVSLAYLKFNKGFLPYRVFDLRRNNSDYFKKIAKVGIPVSALMAGKFSSSFITTVMISHLGKKQLIVYQAAAEYLYLFSPIRLGLGDTSQVLVSQALGRNDVALARKFGTTAILLATTLSTLASVSLLVAPIQMASVFLTIDDDTQNLIRFMFLISACTHILDSIREVSTHSLRGINDTSYAMIVGLLCMVVAGIPLEYAAGFVFNLDLIGISLAVCVSIAANAALLAHRWEKPPTLPESLTNNISINSAPTPSALRWCSHWKKKRNIVTAVNDEKLSATLTADNSPARQAMKESPEPIEAEQQNLVYKR
jgi:MATE family multidrug resistance protein